MKSCRAGGGVGLASSARCKFTKILGEAATRGGEERGGEAAARGGAPVQKGEVDNCSQLRGI